MAEIKNLPFKDGYIDGITILNLEGEVLFRQSLMESCLIWMNPRS